MSKKIAKPQTEDRDAFIKAIAELDPLEITWALNALADTSAKRITDHRNDILRLRAFGKDASGYVEANSGADAAEEIARAEKWITFHEKMIRIVSLWRAAKNEFEIPKIIAALRKHHA